MASYAYYDSTKQKYILGKGSNSCTGRDSSRKKHLILLMNWSIGIGLCRLHSNGVKRMDLARNKKWDDVIEKAFAIAVQDNKYLFTESATDSYTNPEYRTDHPSVLGALGMLPQTRLVRQDHAKYI